MRGCNLRCVSDVVLRLLIMVFLGSFKPGANIPTRRLVFVGASAASIEQQLP